MTDENIKEKKFVIIRGKGSGKDVTFNDSDKIEVTFNPKEYSVNKKNNFSDQDIPGLMSPIFQFGKGDARTLGVDLMLDTLVSEKPGKKKEDVRTKYIQPLQELLELDKDLHAPPPCQVLWGSLNFKGVLQSMDTTYTLFNNEGVPVRATVKLSFKEFIPLEVQDKYQPLNSPDRRKLFKMTEGDSIWNMANKAYGDAGLWRVIADANDIDDPGKIEMGRDMIIPVWKNG
jgi:hypothetical protein